MRDDFIAQWYSPQITVLALMSPTSNKWINILFKLENMEGVVRPAEGRKYSHIRYFRGLGNFSLVLTLTIPLSKA